MEKPDTTGHVFHDPICVKYSEQAALSSPKADEWLSGARGRGSDCLMGDKADLNQDGGDGSIILEMFSISLNCTF